MRFGLEGDIDYKSFIDPKIVGNVKECQEYIFHQIKKGDYINLIKKGNKFYIHHKDRRIGMMNIENLFKNTFFYANGWEIAKKEVKAYKGLRVKDKITIAKFSDYIEDEYEAPYKDTGLWNAIELEGFGKIEFEEE